MLVIDFVVFYMSLFLMYGYYFGLNFGGLGCLGIVCFVVFSWCDLGIVGFLVGFD